MACSLPRRMDPGNSLEISIMGSSILNPPTKSKKKEMVVRGSMPGRVVCGRHSGPLSLHCTGREVIAARSPASRAALRSNTAAASPSGQTAPVTPCLEWAGPPHAPAGPYPAPHVHTLLLPLGSQAVATPPRCWRCASQWNMYALD
ncbi:hypothetical protein KC19_5G023600, partial [Ceratodon purpureus]